MVKLASDITIKNVKVLTLEGKIIIDKDFNVNKVKLTLENMIPGVYMYNIIDSTGKLHTGKLMIK